MARPSRSEHRGFVRQAITIYNSLRLAAIAACLAAKGLCRSRVRAQPCAAWPARPVWPAGPGPPGREASRDDQNVLGATDAEAEQARPAPAHPPFASTFPLLSPSRRALRKRPSLSVAPTRPRSK